MSRTVVMPRKTYEVKSQVSDPIRLYLDTGVQRHINPGDTIILIGETAGRVGLDREMHRGRVSFREFNIVMPETDDPKIAKSKLFKDALKQYEDVMKHLFSGNVLYLTAEGELSVDPPEAPKIDDSEQVERLEETMAPKPELKVVKDEEPEDSTEAAEESPAEEEEPEIILDEEEEDGEEEAEEEDKPAKKNGRKKSRKKSKK